MAAMSTQTWFGSTTDIESALAQAKTVHMVDHSARARDACNTLAKTSSTATVS
jgi:hypothetical protein